LKWLLIIVLCLANGVATASPPPPYVINDSVDSARITIYAEYLADLDAALTLDDVRSGVFDDLFIPARRGTQRLGFHRHPFWLRLAIRNDTDAALQRVLELSPGLASSITFYEVREGIFQGRQSGIEHTPPWADLRGRDQLFLIDLPAAETRLYYIRIVPTLSFGFSLHLHDITEQASRQLSRDMPYLILGGLVLGLIILVTGLWLYTRQPLYLHYLLFQSSALIVIAAGGGFLGVLCCFSPGLQPRIETFTELVALSFAALFTREFLKPRQKLPRMDLALRMIAMISPALALFTLSLPVMNAGILAYSASLLGALIMAATGIAALYVQLPHAGLYLLARGSLLVAVTTSMLAAFGIIPLNMPFSLLVLSAMSLEAVLFAIGLMMHREHSLREQLLGQQRQMLDESMWRTRSDTLSRVSHEIRTPMSGILGMAELLDDTPLTPNQKECVRSIHSAGENLLRIINDVLEYSRIEQSGSALNRERFDPGELVMSALELFRERAEEKQIELIAHIHSNVPAMVEGDPGRLRQILTNILSACVRHAGAGELVVDVSRDPSGRADHLRFEFEGSALKHIENSLDALQDRDSLGQQDATDLGLNIAHQLSEAIGGRCGLREGRNGQLCWVVVPLPEVDTAESEELEDNGAMLAGRHMLVVDDSSTVTRVIRHQALSWGMRVTVCHDPREALASIRMQANLKDPYDIVLLDHLMPGMNGMQLATRIHEDLLIGHPLVLVMLTGVQDAPTTNLARNVGIHKVLTKPVSGRRLRHALSEALGILSSPTISNEEPVMPDSSLRILVAEDHMLSQKVIRGMLGKLGLDADIVSNGVEALAAFEKKPYDLILMDCEMPEMDGFEATQRLRELERQRGKQPVPIIALTAHVLSEHRQRALSAGMNAHVGKPIELGNLAEIIVRFTRKATTANSNVADTGPATVRTSDEKPE
jgi:CheY-like chemotaxis protein/signal transduction histidine kinase